MPDGSNIYVHPIMMLSPWLPGRRFKNTIFDDVKTYARSLKENKILRENAEHNDKVVDKVNWENMLLKKRKSRLKETT